MADKQGEQHGPIRTGSEEYFGHEHLKGDTSGIFDGEPGYPKGTGGKLPELIYDQAGEFGKVKTDHKSKE